MAATSGFHPTYALAARAIMAAMSTITIRGARLHNLKDVSLSIPKNKLVVFSGLSGSGKSTLALNTLHMEG